MSTPKTFSAISWEPNTYGVIEALKDAQARAGDSEVRGYPPNTWGVIKAIEDLAVNGNVIIDDKPPGWAPGEPGGIDEEEGKYPTAEPNNGTLWYDTRQGRLYVWSDTDWYQTNGADGYPVVSDTAPANPVMGQLWVDSGNQYAMYVFTTQKVNINRALIAGTITDPSTVAYQEAWVPVAGDGTLQNTANLPLANPTTVTTNARAAVDFPDSADLAVQADYNAWILKAFNAVNLSINELSNSANVFVDTVPPVSRPGTELEPGYDIQEGDLWFDTLRLDLNIYYDSYWVSVSGAQEVTMDKIDTIGAEVKSLNQEVNEIARSTGVLFSDLGVHKSSIEAIVAEIRSDLQVGLTSLPTPITQTEVNQIVEPLETKLSELEAELGDIDLSPYATKVYADQKTNLVGDRVTTLENSLDTNYFTIPAVQNYVTSVADTVTSLIPDVSDKVDADYVQHQIALLDYMPRTGGSISSIDIIRQSTDKAAFNFGTSQINGYKAFAFISWKHDAIELLSYH